MEYIALIRKEDGTEHGVEFPDFPGCVTSGTTLAEAMANAREALEMHVDGLIEDGGAVPQPSTLDAVMADSFNKDAVAALVQLPPLKSRSVRVDITMDERLLKAVDTKAKSVGSNRSRFLADAARAALERVG
jgi:predicted RNase H-like HicB family nuclease